MKLNFKAATQAQTTATPQHKGVHRIMLVDDEAPNLNALARHLADEFEVVSFTSAKEALRLIDRGGPDSEVSVVITAQIMPEMSGVEFLTELQKRQHPAPRIILTGYGALENLVTAVNNAAIFRFLAKPVNIEFMLQAIREAISTVEMRHENSLLLTMVKGLLEKNAELQKQMPADAPEHTRDLTAAFPPQRHEVVVVFADIRGFTRASKGAEPELVIKALNQVFQPFHEIIYNAGGVVDKHLGDGLMAIFGLLGGNSRNAALMATQQMVDRATIILPALKEPMHDLKISFGVAAGTVVLGMMGSSFRSELAIIGETANFGARLQEISKQALSPIGQKNFGIFDRSIAVCSANLLGLNANFKKVDLSAEILIRDFSEIRTIGVYNPNSSKA